MDSSFNKTCVVHHELVARVAVCKQSGRMLVACCSNSNFPCRVEWLFPRQRPEARPCGQPGRFVVRGCANLCCASDSKAVTRNSKFHHRIGPPHVSRRAPRPSRQTTCCLCVNRNGGSGYGGEVDEFRSSPPMPARTANSASRAKKGCFRRSVNRARPVLANERMSCSPGRGSEKTRPLRP